MSSVEQHGSTKTYFAVALGTAVTVVTALTVDRNICLQDLATFFLLFFISDRHYLGLGDHGTLDLICFFC